MEKGLKVFGLENAIIFENKMKIDKYKIYYLVHKSECFKITKLS